jgi:hypothetical protein
VDDNCHNSPVGHCWESSLSKGRLLRGKMITFLTSANYGDSLGCVIHCWELYGCKSHSVCVVV